MCETTSLNRSIDRLADEVENGHLLASMGGTYLIDAATRTILECKQRQEASRALWGLCEKFVRDNQISCAESVYQNDHVIENGYELIAKICGIVGFHNEEA